MAVFSASEIDAGLKSLPDWHLADGSLTRNLEFSDFREAMSFVNSVAWLAERAGHHPDLDIRYNKVKIAISSHDAGGITEKDFALATEIGHLL
jgi:4a-hydroxytetrahydrobiopterin dehydratase